MRSSKCFRCRGVTSIEMRNCENLCDKCYAQIQKVLSEIRLNIVWARSDAATNVGLTKLT